MMTAALAVGLGLWALGAAEPAFAAASRPESGGLGGCVVALHSIHCRTSRDREEWVRENCRGGSLFDCGMGHCRFVGNSTIVCHFCRHRRRHFHEGEIEAGAGGTSQGMDVMTVLAGLGVAASGVVLAVRRRRVAA